MTSSNDDPIASAAKGTTEATLNWSEAKIKELIQKFKNKDLAFIKNEEEISEIKQITKNEEFKLFKRYIKDKPTQLIFKLGLFLRKLENDRDKYESLKKKILKKHKSSGLHTAYFAQNKLFTKLHTSLIERFTQDVVKKELREFFTQIDKYTLFISATDSESQKVQQATSKIYAHSPETFIISSWMKGAMKLCKKIHHRIHNQINNEYTSQSYTEQEKQMYMFYKTLQ